MKIAFHFDATAYQGNYSTEPLGATFRLIVNHHAWFGTSKVFTGDLILTGDNPSKSQALKAAYLWLSTSEGQWSGVDVDRFLPLAIGHAIYTICIDSIEASIARDTHRKLQGVGSYVGAQEVDYTNKIQLSGTSRLIHFGRIVGKRFRVFASHEDPEHLTEETREWRLVEVRDLGAFDAVDFEITNMRRTIFDTRPWPQGEQQEAHARRVLIDIAETMIDRTLSEFGDGVLSFPETLFAATSAFERAATSEQYAHVGVSCRRLLDQVADQLYPPRADSSELGPSQTMARLMQFVKERAADEKTAKVLEREINDVYGRITALRQLANRLLHAPASRDAARRCLIQTVVLLDDIRALAGETLPMAIDEAAASDMLRSWLEGR